jgi:hypothetical protein
MSTVKNTFFQTPFIFTYIIGESLHPALARVLKKGILRQAPFTLVKAGITEPH